MLAFEHFALGLFGPGTYDERGDSLDRDLQDLRVDRWNNDCQTGTLRLGHRAITLDFGGLFQTICHDENPPLEQTTNAICSAGTSPVHERGEAIYASTFCNKALGSFPCVTYDR